MDTMGRNNLQLAPNNTFNTLGRNGNNTFKRNQQAVAAGNKTEVTTNTLGRNNRYADVAIANPIYR